jgi:hypothetical protein
MCVDPCHAGRIDVVQGTEFGIRIPPAMGDFPEFVDFVLIGVGMVCSMMLCGDSSGYGPVGAKKKSPAGQGFFAEPGGITWCR